MTAILASTPIEATPSAAENLGRDHFAADAQDPRVPANTLDLGRDHCGADAHSCRVPADHLSERHHAGDTQRLSALAQDLASDQIRPVTQTSNVAGSFSEYDLRLAAETLNDAEAQRMAAENRLRAAEQDGMADVPSVAMLRRLLEDVLLPYEHQCVLELQRALRRHPLGGWVKSTVGVGEKQGARLIASIGDPGWNHAEDRLRRGPAELWAYCGYRPGQKRQRGVKSNWNAEAKSRAYLVASSCIKQAHSPYRDVYDKARAGWADRDTTDMHKHNHALRCVAKAILRDLWKEATSR